MRAAAAINLGGQPEMGGDTLLCPVVFHCRSRAFGKKRRHMDAVPANNAASTLFLPVILEQRHGYVDLHDGLPSAFLRCLNALGSSYVLFIRVAERDRFYLDQCYLCIMYHYTYRVLLYKRKYR
jgi:hypothetical protein